MAPHMSKTAAAAAVVAGTAFVSLPSQRSAPTSRAPALRGNAPAHANATGMMSTVGSVALGATAVAALRKKESSKASQLKAFENELGVQPPLGFWDPAGLSSDGDAREFYRRRVVEIKHGRVPTNPAGKLCTRLFGEGATNYEYGFLGLPGYLGGKAIEDVPAEGWLQWVALCGCYEFCVNTPVDAAEPGNYGKGRLGYGNMVLGITAEPMQDAEARKRALNSELANGRLAMMAIVGLWVQDGLFGSPYGLYTGSSAFESELGVQPPVGFWDPLGFTKTDDAASFRRRRYVELKHGRVAMFACLGYIVPEYYRWPGDLSPSLGLKFSDVPTGFAAFSKVPLSGWAQMVFFAGSVELFQYVDDPKRAPGDFANAGFLGVPNSYVKAPEGTKEKKLAAEIANGRLAMMAIIGMFFQDGLTGSAWGDWANYTDSPLRALTPAQECIAGTGGPLPDMYWDPAGITSKKSKEEILELRAQELKHGRVAMLACIGWFHVAGGFHIIGDYAVGVHLDDNPLVSLTQMPMGGIWQVVFTIMCLEWLTTYVCKPPAEKPWDILGWSDILVEDEKSIWNQFRKAELQELNNSRLAMMGIVGLITQARWDMMGRGGSWK
ncbi:Fucoxanthin-chlorophyll a-c binding protein E [Durusdinium trenchii]|uniref:Chloroplastic n=1 Tax=Durusdinium trenchii TaxID=1381693 RepID=A0ABP0QDL4_9DINO